LDTNLNYPTRVVKVWYQYPTRNIAFVYFTRNLAFIKIFVLVVYLYATLRSSRFSRSSFVRTHALCDLHFQPSTFNLSSLTFFPLFIHSSLRIRKFSSLFTPLILSLSFSLFHFIRFNYFFHIYILIIDYLHEQV
jgi:hypothetical protein